MNEEIFYPFAKVAFELKKELQIAEQNLRNEPELHMVAIYKKQISSLTHLIDRCFRLTGDLIPVGVSKKAKKYCDDNQFGDIFKIGWGEQLKFEKKKNRTECQLKHEHKIPVKTLINNLKEANTIEEIIIVFKSQKIVWILKVEDSLLPKSNRPDPDEDYRKAGIEVLDNPNPIGYLFQNKINIKNKI